MELKDIVPKLHTTMLWENLVKDQELGKKFWPAPGFHWTALRILGVPLLEFGFPGSGLGGEWPGSLVPFGPFPGHFGRFWRFLGCKTGQTVFFVSRPPLWRVFHGTPFCCLRGRESFLNRRALKTVYAQGFILVINLGKGFGAKGVTPLLGATHTPAWVPVQPRF